MKPKTTRIVLNDGSGGLNNRDLPGSLKQNEFSQLENIYTDEGGFPGKQVPGAQVVQYTTIDPEPFVADASTALLLHLDEASSSVTIADSSGNARDLTVANNAVNHNTQVPGVFPIGAPLGQGFYKNLLNDNTFLARFSSGAAQLGIDGAAAVTFEAWVEVKSDFTGAPTVPALPIVSGVNGFYASQVISNYPFITDNTIPVYQTGSPIIATANGYPYSSGRPLVFESGLQNGITIHRDYDATLGKDVGDPYAKFTIKTNGVAGTVTEVTSNPLTVGDKLHIRGVYDSATGEASIYVNGTLNKTKSVVGAGTVNNVDGDAVAVGGWTSNQLLDPSSYGSPSKAAYLVGPYVSPGLPPANGLDANWQTSYYWEQALSAANAAIAYCTSVADAVGIILFTAEKIAIQAQQAAQLLLFNAYVSIGNATDTTSALAAYASIGTAIDAYNTNLPIEQASYDAAIAHLAWPDLTTYHNYAVNSYCELSYPVASAAVVIDEVRVSTTARTTFPFFKPRTSWGVLEKSDGTQQIVGPAGDGLYYTVGDGNYTLIKSGLSETAKWCWQQMGDILYGCNGVDDPIAWDGERWVKWFEGNTPLGLQELGSGAAPVAGAYNYYYTYVYGTEETGPSPATALTLSGTTNVIITQIPTRHDNCSYIRIYRTKAGATTKYLLREIANDPNQNFLTMDGPYNSGGTPQTDTGSDGVADATLGTGSYSAITAEVDGTSAPNPRILTENFDRIFMAAADDSPYQAFWTEPGLPDIVLPTSFVTSKGNRKLSALSKSQGEVQAHKEGRGCLVLRGSEPSNWRQFDNLHPDLGAVDHFGIVYRTVSKQDGSGTDVTEVCMLTPQGWYGYQGYDFYRIDEPINGTFKTLAQANSTRLEYITTSQAQFQSCENNGGGASDNIQASRYETDGLREVAGEVRIVNQLDYLGLWTSSGALVAGNVIATAKAPGEGCFYFGTDAASTLWYTTDNFQTATAITGNILNASERIIEIVKQGAADNYFLITDTAGTGLSSGGGNIYTVNDPTGVAGIGPAWTKLTSSALYYDLDVPMYINGDAGNFSGRQIGNGSYASTSGGPAGSSNNIYINHQQNILPSYSVVRTDGRVSNYVLESCPSITGRATAVVASGQNSGDGTYGQTISVGVGFYAAFSGFLGLSGGDNFDLHATYTRREFPLWRGGTFRPQAYWDSTNSRLVFLASTAQDGNGNRSTYLRTIDTAGTLTNQYTAENVVSLTSDGTSIYFNTVLANTTILFGFASRLRRSLLATPGTVAGSSNFPANTMLLRMAYNSHATSRLLVAIKALITGTQNFWTYTGSLQALDPTTAALTSLKSETANGDSGAVVTEIAVQTTTPYSWFAAVDAPVVGTIYKVDAPGTAAANLSTYKSSPYTSPVGDAPVNGIISNLLFVESSGVTGDYQWSDRLYWMGSAATASNARMIQLGVPGTWSVHATFTGALTNLGTFDALGDFDVDYSGNINFDVANGAAGPFVDTDFIPVAPNQRLTLSSSAPQAYIQWTSALVWDYSVASPTESPYFEFVSIGYFLGDNDIPSVAAVHYKGRTRWAVAQSGETNNNLEVVYQKNNKWTTCPNRNIVCYMMFRGELLAFVDYTLVQMEKGPTWMGASIEPLAVTGYIMDTLQDKYIRNLKANVMEYVNSSNPSATGYFMVVPIAAGVDLDASQWYVPIPATAGPDTFPKQVVGAMTTFAQKWVRAMALKITRSDSEGDYQPASTQVMDVQALIVDIRLSVPRDLITVD